MTLTRVSDFILQVAMVSSIEFMVHQEKELVNYGNRIWLVDLVGISLQDVHVFKLHRLSRTIQRCQIDSVPYKPTCCDNNSNC